VHAQRPVDPPRMYSWTLVTGAGAGAMGITDDYERALDNVVDALATAPAGSRGLVHRIWLSYHRAAYVYEGLVARCRLGVHGAEWDDIPPPSTWTHLHPLFTDPDADALGDAIPPEALATGFEDLRAQQERLTEAIGQSKR
jgi:hypothetical protein